MSLTKDQILKVNKETMKINVPEWGGDVHLLKSMSIAFMDTLKGDELNIVDCLMYSVVDESGNHLFSELDRESLKSLDAKVAGKVVAEWTGSLNIATEVEVAKKN